PAMTELTNALKDFMYEHLYLTRAMPAQLRARIHAIITTLFHAYMADPARAPGLAPTLPAPARARAVCDHIAGMTDAFAEQDYQRLCAAP
ncbi:MAG TPA: deoxyguanosinetriphosphate triphosphohydrolase, partial [Armatimonadota bacterium]|nr:deoxyguanosinetriphosphate triphosphohydrolase [Armatimonadota bacterium]